MNNLHLLLSALDGNSLLLLKFLLSLEGCTVESVVDLLSQLLLGGGSADCLLLADLLHLGNVASQLLHSLFSLSESLLTCFLEMGVDLLLELVGLHSVKGLSLVNEGESAFLSHGLVVNGDGDGASSLLLGSLQFLSNLL